MSSRDHVVVDFTEPLERAGKRIHELQARIAELRARLESTTLTAILEEREACAQIAEDWYGYVDEAAADIALRIRARSNPSNS